MAGIIITTLIISYYYTQLEHLNVESKQDMLYFIWPLDILLESEEALIVYIAGPLFLGNYLYSDTASATHLHASGQQSVQKLVEIEFGDEGQNCQININTNFPCYLYVAVPGRNRTLFHCIFRSHCCV